MRGEQSFRVRAVLAFRGFQHFVGEQTLPVPVLDVVGAGGVGPGGAQAGGVQHLFGAAALAVGDDEHGHALAPCPPRAAAAMQQGFRVGGQIRVDDEIQRRQIQPARGDIRANPHAGAAGAQRIQRGGALMLAKFARQHNGGETALHQGQMQPPRGIARGAEHQRAGGFIPAQDVDQRGVCFVPGAGDGAVFDVVMRHGAIDGVDAQSIPLIFTGQIGDVVRDGGGKHQGAAIRRRGLQDRFQFFLKAEVEHFVRLIQHHDLQRGEAEVFPA